MFSITAYMEGTEESLAEALSTCLTVYNNGTSQRLDLVFFSEAIRHAARLSRVLVCLWSYRCYNETCLDYIIIEYKIFV